ncbi:hypothetical protein QWY75_09415 [Pontixanthobacter aestiaquae]|uniref:Ferric reductase like transmembrane component n=1 Tax=Pontixanthobacter aestiaquae TaxID=1509367 RepID=A0A844Z3U4_9SPHN|nr:hypothetical protein [Pontixanthobacter aestiaquae]MDN3646415.1 hypothetical protein [Pontixanthobacter aestiaquae]MXO82595.1 hypothetical protein [Pontixanthobacter aestiaquae]
MASSANFERAEQRRDTDHESFLSHKRMRWLKVSVVLCLIVIVSYFLVDVEPRHNGGTWYGYTLGTIGALLIVWLSLLGIRKRNMSPGRWSLKAWTSAHVYLGLALIVIGTMHTGFQLGWNVHTLAWALMMLVVVSGIYGISVYATLPRSLSNNAREMTRGQMVEALAAIDRQLETAAQPLGRSEADAVIDALKQDVFKAGFLARLTGTYPRCATARAQHAFPPGSINKKEEKVAALLGRRKSQLGQIRRHMRYRALLEVWLFIHIPATIALIAALAAHIVSVFYYW